MDRVPIEILQQILRDVDGSSNLFSVVRVCRTFAAVGLPYLYEDLVWKNALQALNNLSFWSEHPQSQSWVHSLTVRRLNATNNAYSPPPLTRFTQLGGCRIHPGSVVAGPDSVWGLGFATRLGVEFPLSRRPQEEHPLLLKFSSTHPLTILRTQHNRDAVTEEERNNVALCSLVSFASLRRLTLTTSRLPARILAVIHEFPNLRELHIINCDVSLRSGDGEAILDHSGLQLTDLTLWGIHRMDVPFAADDHPARVPVYRFYSLMSCGTLRRLRLLIQDHPDLVDVLSETARSQIPADRQLLPRVSADLEELTYAWVSVLPVLMLHARKESLLRYLLQNCPRITDLSCLGTGFPWLPSNVLPNLRAFRGPMTKQFVSKLANSPVERITLEYGLLEEPYRDVPAEQPIPVIQELHAAQLPLQELSMSVLHWDDDLIQGICSLFAGLHRLEVKYTRGCPSEEMYMIMGNQLWPQMPALRSVSLFAVPELGPIKPGLEPYPKDRQQPAAWIETRLSPSYRVPWSTNDRISEQDMFEVLMIWTHYCPHLRDVQLCRDFVWRRSHEKDIWVKREMSNASTAQGESVVLPDDDDN
ncbi:hypothetical protein PUNSTDRAFT_142337 [Punctularia strigosozonata HHB-11173 SS5]|uniref:uncharacterized protein n=1 Tax=Punctularia strigosozonata (strain HHB-11173) TaxID=741275 RepID=UPI00044180F4|nr:uncharacterized protein PUNSTDRAFT_142337 [Punctularia strigosozonata HHB-11173 SS5]EIN10273.1 hypothetical protein PUNSTDRAFT_142337 [Punctularia strigosozonata HHB-11173 SS5]